MKFNALARLGRFKEIVSVFIKYGFADVIRLLDLPGSHLAERILDVDVDQSPAVRVRQALDELGPTFVKFGQIMSLRGDMLPEAMVAELQKLQDNALPVDIEAVKTVIRNNMDADWDAVFLSIDPEPLAAASLSQVHRGVLRDGNLPVVLKVQRPGIEAVIDQDLAILAAIADRIHERIDDLKVYDLPGLVRLAHRSMERELNFSREARYLQIARGHLEDLEGIYVPKAFPELSTRQLLVMEHVAGESLRTIDPEQLKNPAEMARNGLRAAVRQLFEVGFFHADPHPGNTLIVDGHTICLLDWGMVGRLSPRDRYDLIDLIGAMVEKDSGRLVDALINITTGEGEIDRRALERDLLDILDAHLVAAMNDLQLGQLLFETTSLIRRYQMRIPVDFFIMIKSLITVEGLVRKIYPEMDLVAELHPHLKRVAAKRFSPESVVNGMRALFFRLASVPTRLPRRIGDFVEKMEHGRLRIGFEHRNLEGLQHTLEKIFSRLTMGVIIGAMIIGSSLIITTGIPPIVWGYPLLGLAGYLFSGILGVWVIFDILRSR